VNGLRFAFALAALVCAGSLAGAQPARAETRTYLIAIGNNRPPESARAELSRLQYADDDAADFAMFARELGAETTLLTVLDHESQERFPGLAQVALAPTLAALRRTVAELRQRFEADRQRGADPVLLLFFSGHGLREPGEPAALAMLDGPLTQRVLYDEVLAVLPARFVHLIVDACHAEAVVRPRDLSADLVDLSADDVTALAAKNNLERFPHVGALVAAESAAQAHEWEVYQRGIFTHEVLSGLRGAADVNADGRIEYSELSAFLTAANREIANPRARPSIVVRVPALDRRAAIVDTSALARSGRLIDIGGTPRKFSVEDGLGNRLADVYAEADHALRLTLPADEALHLRMGEREATFVLPQQRSLALGDLELHKTPTRARSALASSLNRGLFATPFGPIYYRGFVDSHPEFVSVPAPALPASELTREGASGGRRRAAGWLLTSLGVAAGIAAGVCLGLAFDARDDYRSTELERPAGEAADRYDRQRGAAIGLGVAAAASLGAGTWMLVSNRGARH
jgi:hypothetical protein